MLSPEEQMKLIKLLKYCVFLCKLDRILSTFTPDRALNKEIFQ